MNDLREAADILEMVARSLRQAGDSLTAAECRLNYLENELYKEQEFKRKMLDLLQEYNG